LPVSTIVRRNNLAPAAVNRVATSGQELSMLMTATLRSFSAAVVLAALTAPTFAAVKYYVYHEPTTQHCWVVKGSALMMYGTSYDTQAEAEAALKADKSCK
jgi:hypothetical protein